MKRFAVICLCAVLLSCTALGEKPSPSREAEQLLVSQALSLCGTMDACADDPAFVRLYANAEDVQKEILQIGGQDWARPVEATLYVIQEPLFDTYLSASSIDLDALSEPVRERLKRNIPSSLPSLINSVQGTAFMTAASILGCGKVFLCDGTDVPPYCLLHLSFGGGYEALCSFVVSDGAIVSAQLSPIKKGGVDWLLWQMTLSGAKRETLFQVTSVDLNN